MRIIKFIVVHCSDSRNHTHDAKVIDQWHKARGFNEIGYHYVITPAWIQLGRSIHKIPAAQAPYNSGSIAI